MSKPGFLLCRLALLPFLGLSLSLPAAAQTPPDLSGVWMPVTGPGNTVIFPRAAWPFTAQGQAIFDAFEADFDQDRDSPEFFCVQPGMPMTMAAAAPFPVEIIQREQDVTLYFEAYNQYRKIFIEGHPRPEPILASRVGYSVGQWEGEELVVHTDHLAERTLGRAIMSGDATISERIRVEAAADGSRLLIDEIVFHDPATYSEDIQMRGVWREASDTPIMEYVCTEELYQKHLDSVRGTR